MFSIDLNTGRVLEARDSAMRRGALEPDCLGARSPPPTTQLCDLRQVISPGLSFLVTKVRSTHLTELQMVNEVTHLKGLEQCPAHCKCLLKGRHKHCSLLPPCNATVTYCSVGLLRTCGMSVRCILRVTACGYVPSDFYVRLLFSFSSGNFKEAQKLRTLSKV